MTKNLFVGVVLGATLFSGASVSNLSAQTSSVQQELSKRNITLQQARQLAQRAGINPNDPAALARFARSQGVSEEQIQAWLRDLNMGGESSNPAGLVTDLRDAGVQPKDITQVGTYSMGSDTTVIRQVPLKNGLPYFGYNIFRNVPDAFKPASTGPVDGGYIIGPEDEMRLTLWGATEFQYELAVDAEGRIFIPSIGQITVAGQTLSELREYLKTRLSQSYSGLTRNPPTIFLDVTLTRLRPIRVFVIGELEQPGGYTFSSYSTLFNVLYGVGGPAINGSLRNIQLIREGKVVTTFDLYDFLLRGIDSGSIRLQNNDRIFIPPRNNTISIKGPVRRPAVYELKNDEGLSELIRFSGGLLPEAYGKRFHVNRIIPLTERKDPSIARTVIDYNLQEVLAGSAGFTLLDGDNVEILDISDRLENVVYIEGAVYQPGAYQLSSEVQTIKDLIIAADSLQGDAYVDQLELVRTNEDLSKDFFSIDYELMMEGHVDHNLALQRLDRVRVYNNTVERIDNKFVEIHGEVERPGRYEFSEGMDLGDLILNAGGFSEEAYLGDVEVSRLEKPEDANTKSVQFFVELSYEEKDRFYSPSYLDELLQNAREFELVHRDKIFVRENPRFEEQQLVKISGEVQYPGSYALLRENEKLSDLFRRTGGLTPEGYAGGAKLFRDSTQVIIDISRALSGRVQEDMELLPGDSIHVPRVPNTVLVTGNVGNEGLVKFVPGEKVSYYLERVGGMQRESEKRVLLTQPDGTTFSVKRKGWFKKNPEVYDGATITVLRKPVEVDQDKLTPRELLQESTAILTSALTVILLVDRVFAN